MMVDSPVDNIVKLQGSKLIARGIELDLYTGIYSIDGRGSQHNKISTKTARLFKLLIDNVGTVVSKKEILDKIWFDRPVTLSSLTVAIHNLRALICSMNLEDEITIKNFSGFGYGLYIDDLILVD
ncbi:winged helix-turn-helix domain-containing protein [Vibrio splendidus]|uniref:winged helix-turn-helix domain-containing protein n=1 Tax=Vibrio splendidus TaxID=29497 RepID=UPI0022358B8A|nr:helix-turn-helix domain-containing protein [Vibrio splendidus]MCW4438861.1 helix-turn-helix domain-containing protein [Vibrio splendidus]